MIDVSTQLQSSKAESGYSKRSFLREAMYPNPKDMLLANVLGNILQADQSI